MPFLLPAAARGFLTGPVVQGRFWQRPASWSFFDPTLLSCAKKRGVEPPRRNCYFTLARKYTRVCGPLCDPSGSSQAMPSLSGASTVFASTLVLDCNCKLVCCSYNDQTAGQQIWQSSPPQGIFALQKSLRGDCGGDGVPAAVGRGTARAKKFPEEICFVPCRVCQIRRTPTSNHSKVRRHTRQEQSQYRAAPGCQRDRGPSVSGRVQRNPFQGVPLGNFFAEARHRASFRR